MAIWGAIGAGVGLHVMNSLGEISDRVAGLQKLSPFYYYLGGDPLNNGMDWTHAAMLAAICVVLDGAVVPAVPAQGRPREGLG